MCFYPSQFSIMKNMDYNFQPLNNDQANESSQIPRYANDNTGIMSATPLYCTNSTFPAQSSSSYITRDQTYDNDIDNNTCIQSSLFNQRYDEIPLTLESFSELQQPQPNNDIIENQTMMSNLGANNLPMYENHNILGSGFLDIMNQQSIVPSVMPVGSVALEDLSEPNHNVLINDMTLERKQKRMIKNRESAARSRAKKQKYIEKLEGDVQELKEQNKKLQNELKIMGLHAVQKPKNQLRRSRSCNDICDISGS